MDALRSVLPNLADAARDAGEDPISWICLFEDDAGAAEFLQTWHLGFAGTGLARAAQSLMQWRNEHQRIYEKRVRMHVQKAREPRMPLVERPTLGGSYEEEVGLSKLVGMGISRMQMRQSAKYGPLPKADLEEAERIRWVRILNDYLLETDWPLVGMAKKAEHTDAMLMRAWGARRAKTLRNRGRSWYKLRTWLLLVKETPFQIFHVTWSICWISCMQIGMMVFL